MVRRVRLRRDKQNIDEALVLFADVETRDRVSSYARNLSKFIDVAGKPTAGVRFDIPDHLHGVHRTLLQYGHAMWEKFGRDPEFKRNIRHDDAELTFCMDMKIPKKQNWITITYARALADKKQKTATLMEDEELLSSSTRAPFEVPAAEDNNEPGTGESGPYTPGGSVTSYSWRAPRKNA